MLDWLGAYSTKAFITSLVISAAFRWAAYVNFWLISIIGFILTDYLRMKKLLTIFNY